MSHQCFVCDTPLVSRGPTTFACPKCEAECKPDTITLPLARIEATLRSAWGAGWSAGCDFEIEAVSMEAYLARALAALREQAP